MSVVAENLGSLRDQPECLKTPSLVAQQELSPNKPPSPYEVLSTGLEFPDNDQKQWWPLVASPIQALLKRASYDVTHQYQYLMLIHHYVLPALGPAPNRQKGAHWDSFMTDDFSPFEPSINLHGGKATVRLGLEPVGPLAGTEEDPLNQIALQQFITSMESFSDVTDLQLWRHFSNELHVTKGNALSVAQKLGPGETLSQNLFAFDLGKSKASLKAYFFPYMKSIETGKTERQLIFDALEKLDGPKCQIASSLSLIKEYVDSQVAEKDVRVETISFDCAAPSESRFKVYLRSPYTSFKKMTEAYTLGGRLQDTQTLAGIAALKDLWPLLFGVEENFSEDEELPLNSHRTAGFAYNFEIQPGKSAPDAKFYIPMKHYSNSDVDVAQGLRTYFQQQGWTNLSQTYVDDIKSIFPTHNLASETGTHSWISFSYKEPKGPYLTIYYSPKVYL
ncbi:dimethylallyl tryptophan synthase GliD2 [Stachybotrys elegans]|uniref:Dimethylallyl tryptophan synthase GliD2 n=1 Tax=Stachybotrys elegans TaxID=80388 RepID=A0A8K0WMD1_9HYPO|nr:dimethylallyl tryptophan synthase GliD2 [Stachybotrys elegans]